MLSFNLNFRNRPSVPTENVSSPLGDMNSILGDSLSTSLPHEIITHSTQNAKTNLIMTIIKTKQI